MTLKNLLNNVSIGADSDLVYLIGVPLVEKKLGGEFLETPLVYHNLLGPIKTGLEPLNCI